MNGHLPTMVIKLLGHGLTQKHRLVWYVGNAGLEGNERADALAWELFNRAEHPHSINEPHLKTSKDILAHQWGTRQKYGVPTNLFKWGGRHKPSYNINGHFPKSFKSK